VVLIGMGDVACTALRKSGLGFCAVIVEPGCRGVADQQRIIRDLSKRYRELRDRGPGQ
jgi:hypothetical protein